ncbi:hypothetical protein CGMCC3_g14635 [Colletotrichum fructicola]|nr:uncharacterized protein CGMCC3_g14635 [Colletotrichum fructicola]KAE9569258.1 hypothetical protein CGMCC3_g14635 [Colletotrichum fructicola]
MMLLNLSVILLVAGTSMAAAGNVPANFGRQAFWCSCYGLPGSGVLNAMAGMA